jgi:hypothetical protein
MAWRIKDPKIQATVARALNTTRLGTTGSKDSDSMTDEEEEERVSAKEERVRKKAERTKKKGKKAKRIKRSKEMEEVEEGKTEKAPEPVGLQPSDLEMTDVQDPSDEQPERRTEQLKAKPAAEVKESCPEMEPLKEKTEAERLKREQTAHEGRKMVRESVERVLKGPAFARAESRTLNV